MGRHEPEHPWDTGLGTRREWGRCSHRPVFEGEEFPPLCPEKTVPGLLCHLPRGSGLAEVQAAGDPKGQTLVLSPAELYTIVGAVPSQPQCHGQVSAPGWLSTAKDSAPVARLGAWSWSQLKGLCPQAPGTGENTWDKASCPWCMSPWAP